MSTHLVDYVYIQYIVMFYQRTEGQRSRIQDRGHQTASWMYFTHQETGQYWPRVSLIEGTTPQEGEFPNCNTLWCIYCIYCNSHLLCVLV